MKILFLVPYSSEGASNRFRVEQYLPYLKSQGIDYSIRPFVSSRFFKVLYLKGKYIEKILYFIQAVWKRLTDIFCLSGYDVIFIHREACLIGPPVIEWLAYKLRKPIIFDFDDAIFLENFNPVNRLYRFLKFPSKTRAIIKMSKGVIVSNGFLKEYADRYNSNTCIIPTVVDTDRFRIKEKGCLDKQCVIGWIGSPTTAVYLDIIFPALKELSKKYNFIFRIIGAGRPVDISGIKIENIEWDLKKEIENFQDIDIGIYPLPDTLWAQGKAAFKAIQYMSVGIPVVASPVGMARELIQDGVNGFLADSAPAWVKKMSILIEQPDLREKIGISGRKTIEAEFSVKANACKFLEVIKLAR
ncbi:MAG: glycosyltransferase family 4 protein [Candidatus Omnitrophica bacterium]|nr:glycosyltransferase family 4 protein [Candidatus Omnitrophota bacterium]